MLDYLFNNHRDYFIDPQFTNKYCTFFKSLQLLKHFESLLIQFKSNNPSIIEKDPISFIRSSLLFKTTKNYLDFANHFATNSLYSNDTLPYVHLLSTLASDQSSYKISINFETLKNLFTLSPQPQQQHQNCLFQKSNVILFSYSMRFLKLVDWVFINYHYEFIMLMNSLHSYMNLINVKKKKRI
ncbi:hypothetical protein ACTFIY_008731 [Dictyostelium cf. discoideum]